MKHTTAFLSRPTAALTGLLLFTGCASSPPTSPTASSPATSPTTTGSPTATTSTATPAPSVEPEIAALLPPIDTHVTKDIDRWTLPTDPYDTARFTMLSIHLSHLEEDKCMEDAGFPHFRRATNAFAPAPDGYKPDLQTPLFNQRTAPKYGYRRPPDPRDLIADERQARHLGEEPLEKEGPEFMAAYSQCNNISLERFLAGAPRADGHQPATTEGQPDGEETELESPPPVGPTMGPATELMVDVTQGELPAAAERWRACMAPLQIPDLPAHPWSDLWPEIPQSLRDRWDWKHTFTASEDELQVATHDANCRASSGWQQAYYDAEWERHQQYLDNYRPALENRIAKVRAAEIELVREILKLEATVPDR